MKESTKESIVGAFLLVLACSALVSLIVYAIIDIQQSHERIEFIETSFKESDYNISADYTIVWTESYTYEYSQYLDTDWYYWESEIYNNHRPFKNGWITLWLNIETFESYYEGVLP